MPTSWPTTHPWSKKRALAARGRALDGRRLRSTTVLKEEDATNLALHGHLEEATGLLSLRLVLLMLLLPLPYLPQLRTRIATTRARMKVQNPLQTLPQVRA